MAPILRSLAASLMLFSVAACTGSDGGGDSPDAPGAVEAPVPSAPAPGKTPDTALPDIAGATPAPSQEAVAPAPLNSCGLAASLPLQKGSLRTWLGGVSITAQDSEGFREPGGTELAAFERAFRELLSSGPSAERARDFAQLGYALSTFRDDDSGNGWLVLTEQGQGRGGGTFIVNLAPARDLWLETPHADSDAGTLQQGAEQLVALGARALLITGSNRCAGAAVSPCSGTTTLCGTTGQRVSDAAHYANNFFTAAHRALRGTFPDGVAVSVHGMEVAEEGPEAAIVSDGTSKDRAGSLSVRLRDALNQRLPAGPRRVFSCNAPDDTGKHRALCGTTNVQGRIDNGAGDACYSDAPTASDRFLHLEQASMLRGTASGAVIEALAETVPCSLPGNGLGCPAVASSTGCP
ncbi:hypothetical protein [Pyxidicoccus xibeiensis]|uniref:hypothetical protein n=1 Tax=Pyxidicoccus xibeiensis TaxID=2906759 RepID=UPI0020A7CDE3|nr:hypothetical protein [Pyxidicoccus xibeiensis]MCP3142694.1 hypothetical protein [Pyxidicoccus xibeiensis]